LSCLRHLYYYMLSVYAAGVLKDFFREMPEPLFTNGLYQMLLDAMTVQIADDPHGNAVIMLGIIDCLPSIHQVDDL